MNLRILMVLILAAGIFGLNTDGNAAASDERVQLLSLNKSDEFSFLSDAPESLDALSRDWGQFELEIPKRYFPLPAPNCRGNVRLRFIAIKPDDADRQARLTARWDLLQKLRDITQGVSTEVVIPLNLHHYITHTSNKIELRYCNAYTDGDR